MFTFKQSIANKLLVGIIDASTGVGVTGLAFNAAGLTFKVAKNGAGSATKTLSAPDWLEVSDGWYWVTLSAAECDTLGVGLLLSYYQGAVGSYPFQVVANISSDVMSRLGAPSGASVSADVAAVNAKTTNLPANPASQTNLDVALAAIRALVPFGLSRETVLTRDATTGAPLTTQIYRWDTQANYVANGATGRTEYLATAAYHASGHLATFSVAQV